MTEPLYYAKGMEVWKSPIRTEIEGGESVTLGFHACTASEVVGEEGAIAIAALLCLGEEAQAAPKDNMTGGITNPDNSVKPVDLEDEAYEIGKRDGYSQAVQQIDLLTGGDGEYRYCTDHDPDRHTPGPAEMIQRIVDRFEVLNLLDDATKTGSDEPDDGPASPKDNVTPSQALADIAAERRRQIETEGWSTAHDDEHTNGELALAAGSYCESAARPRLLARKPGAAFAIPKLWPLSWSRDWWKPKSPRQDLVRAGALIIAEIERLDRAATTEGSDRG